MDTPEEGTMQPKLWREGGIWWFQETPDARPVACRDFKDGLERGVQAWAYRQYDQLGWGDLAVANV